MLLVSFVCLAMTLSACGAQSPVETFTPSTPAKTEVTAATQIPAATKTPSAQVSVPPTPETPVPTNDPNCTNSAAFVADVTIPDNTDMAAGATFTKTWRVKNTGTCTWTSNYTLSYYSDEQMGLPSSVPLSVTPPNQTADISVDLRASSSMGTHRSYFVIKNPAGLIMKIDNDSRLWVVINVSSQVASVPTATQIAGSVPVTGSGSATPNAACPYTSDASKVTDMINTVNAYRAANGLPAYTVNALLTTAATAHADDIACNKLFSHDGSDGSTPTTRVAASGYIASSVTENVYGSYPPLSGQGVVDWWKTDQTDIRHNQNLLSVTSTEIGAGYAYYNNFGYYVLVFATPK
jgi:uncharacterized protein YkwD